MGQNASLASILNDKALVFNKQARQTEEKDARLPAALGQSLTPSHIKVVSNQKSNRAKVQVIENPTPNN